MFCIEPNCYGVENMSLWNEGTLHFLQECVVNMFLHNYSIVILLLNTSILWKKLTWALGYSYSEHELQIRNIRFSLR